MTQKIAVIFHIPRLSRVGIERAKILETFQKLGVKLLSSRVEDSEEGVVPFIVEVELKDTRDVKMLLRTMELHTGYYPSIFS